MDFSDLCRGLFCVCVAVAVAVATRFWASRHVDSLQLTWWTMPLLLAIANVIHSISFGFWIMVSDSGK